MESNVSTRGARRASVLSVSRAAISAGITIKPDGSAPACDPRCPRRARAPRRSPPTFRHFQFSGGSSGTIHRRRRDGLTHPERPRHSKSTYRLVVVPAKLSNRLRNEARTLPLSRARLSPISMANRSAGDPARVPRRSASSIVLERRQRDLEDYAGAASSM